MFHILRRSMLQSPHPSVFFFQEYLAGRNPQKISKSPPGVIALFADCHICFRGASIKCCPRTLKNTLLLRCDIYFSGVSGRSKQAKDLWEPWRRITLFASCHICFSGVSGRSKQEKDHQDPWGIVTLFASCHICFSEVSGRNKQEKDHQDPWGIVTLFASCHICFSGVSGRSKEEKDHQDPWGQVQTFLDAGPHQLCGAGSPRWRRLPRLFPVQGTEVYFVCLLLQWNTECRGRVYGRVREWMRCQTLW